MQYILWLSVQAGLPCASVDSNVAHWFRGHLTPDFADILWGLSGPGSEFWITSVIVVTAVAFLLRRSWRRLAVLFLTVPGGALLGESLKWIVQRHRPFESGPFGVWGGYSFPSGHTIAATLMYGFLLVAIFPLLKRKRWRFVVISCASVMVLAVAFSRVALGAHYLTDVLGAMVIGAGWVLLCSASVDSLWRRPTAATVIGTAHACTPSQREVES